LNFDLHSIEIFAVKPGDGTFSGSRVVISYGGFAFLFSSITVLVYPDFGFSGAFVVLDHAN